MKKRYNVELEKKIVKEYEIDGNQQARKILDNLYQGATIYLERKYNRYIELKQLTSSWANATEDPRL